MKDKFYKVTYSRKMHGGHRLIAYNVKVNASDFALMANDTEDSGYGYIIIKAELIYSNDDLLILDSVNYRRDDE